MSKSRKTTYTTSNDDYPSANNRRNSNFNSDKLKSNNHGKNNNNSNSHDDDYDEDNDVYDYDDHNNVIPTVEATVIPYDDIDHYGKLTYVLYHLWIYEWLYNVKWLIEWMNEWYIYYTNGTLYYLHSSQMIIEFVDM